jgi:hypothetical protein
MSDCPSCGHKRLLHDSWGCRDRASANGPCSCGVSIIFLTPLSPLNIPGQRTSPEDEKELLDQAHQFMMEADRKGESRAREMQERAAGEVIPSP